MRRHHVFVGLVIAGMILVSPPFLKPAGVAARSLSPQGDISVTIRGSNGAKPRLAVPEFTVAGAAPELQQAAKTIGEVLWDDLDFEDEYILVSRDAAAKVPPSESPETLPYDRWSELGADAVLLGTVRQSGAGLEVEIRLIGVRGDAAHKQAFGNKYSGCTLKNPRYCAHYISDEFHKNQRNLDGVARTRLAFSSDRNNELVAGRFSGNMGKEIYIADYDGANPQRVTANRSINVSPSWSPDGRLLAYTSYASHFQDVYVQNLYDIKLTRPANGNDVVQNSMPAWSPDGTKIAFTQVRGDGNTEINVMNRDGSGLQRLTNHPLADFSPAWSPTGTQIVFVSDRSGQPQLYVIGVDGTGFERLSCGEQQCDHPSWSTAVNKIAYTCGAPGRYDICLLDMSSRQIIKLTDGVGTNEQPSFAANGRHLVFITTRWAKQQLAMVDLKGTVLRRRITEIGNNTYPSWSRTPQ